MHSRGSLSEMATYDHATYDDVIGEILDELAEAVRVADRHGVPASRVAVDPGFGFAKRPEHNYRVLDELSVFSTLGRPIMVGPSRKRFLGAIREAPPAERDLATAAACVAAYDRGAHLFRVHAVRETREALDVAHAARTA
jgi:dihydropteroate synthase